MCILRDLDHFDLWSLGKSTNYGKRAGKDDSVRQIVGAVIPWTPLLAVTGRELASGAPSRALKAGKARRSLDNKTHKGRVA